MPIDKNKLYMLLSKAISFDLIQLSYNKDTYKEEKENSIYDNYLILKDLFPDRIKEFIEKYPEVDSIVKEKENENKR